MCLWRTKIMMVRCRKCGIVFDLSEARTQWSRVNDIQMMTCGAGGTHRLVSMMMRAGDINDTH